MARDAKRYKAKNEANKKRVEAKSLLEGYVYSARRAIKAKAKKAGDALLAVDKVIEWMDGNKLADDGKFEEVSGDIKRACRMQPSADCREAQLALSRGLDYGLLKFFFEGRLLLKFM